MTTSGSLTIVGTGIQTGQLTMAARDVIQQADKLLYLVAEPMMERYLRSLNRTAESLAHFYEDKKERLLTYGQIVDRIVDEATKGSNVCAAFYGHPGVFVFPSHEAIRRARAAGIPARMLPGISAEDCLFADLGIDPAAPGCQSFEVTDFLLYRRRFDITTSLILWQIGAIGVQTWEGGGYEPRHLDVLAEYLSAFYGANHHAVVYEASTYPMTLDSRAELITLGALPDAAVTRLSTLYVLPKDAPRFADREMVRRLGMNEHDVQSLQAKLHATLPSIHTVTAVTGMGAPRQDEWP